MNAASSPTGDAGTVLVVGAGPVGLTSACELVRQGARVRVVDTLTEPTPQSRAVTVHARTQEHLDAMGALGRVEARAVAQTALEISTGRDATPRVHLTFDHVDSRYHRTLNLAQPETERSIAELAAEIGVVVDRGVTLDSLEHDDTGVTVGLTSAEGTSRHRYGWVVGADGGHSTVRSAVGTRIEGVFEGQHFLFADVSAQTALSDDTTRMFAHPDGIGGVFPMAGGRTRVMFLVDTPAPGAVPTLEQAQQLVDERMAGQWRLSDPNWLTYFEVHHGQVPLYRHGRVLLAGDAAHIHSPAGAQGMNTGMQDAVNLAWKLALVSTGRAGDHLLDSYHDERHPVGAAVVRQTSMMTDAMTTSGPAAALRDLGLFLVGHVPALSERVMAGFAETGIGYRSSPIVDGHAGRHVRAGDHAPDVDGLLTVDGAPARIGELLRRPGHLLLTTSDDPSLHERLRDVLGDIGTVVPIAPTAEEACAGGLVDPGGAVAHHYGIGARGIALIRPDGYLGHLSSAPDVRALAVHLDALLGADHRPGVPSGPRPLGTGGD